MSNAPDLRSRNGCAASPGGLGVARPLRERTFLRQVSFSHLYLASSGTPFFLRAIFLCLICFFVPAVGYGGEVVARMGLQSDFAAAHDALVESIEAEGLVVGAILPFNKMLQRTAGALEKPGSPFAEAEIVQFCSSVLAWELVTEDPAQISLCPLSIALYVQSGTPAKVSLAYRSPGRDSPGRAKADELLRRIVRRVVELTRLR